jgi:transposase
MERAYLEELLAQGLSLAEIGRRVGKHEATVSYWLKQHGLCAANAKRHAARGGITRERLSALVEEGLSIAQISERQGCSKTAVRHWLLRYGLKTRAALERRPRAEARRAHELGVESTPMRCPRHGMTLFVVDRRGYYRCRRCRVAAVARRRRRMKALLVAEAGGSCVVCGYSRNARGLHFHHLDPRSKRIEINARGSALALERLRAEARKCVLLCANCHAEAEAGLIALPIPGSAPYNAPDPGSPG